MNLICQLLGHELMWPRPGRTQKTAGLMVQECARCHRELPSAVLVVPRDLPPTARLVARKRKRRRVARPTIVRIRKEA